MTKTNWEASESHMYEEPNQEDVVTKTHQENGKTYVNENTYQTGIMMNDTYQHEIKDKDHPEEVDEAEVIANSSCSPDDQDPQNNCVARQMRTKETTKRLAVTAIALEMRGGGGHN